MNIKITNIKIIFFSFISLSVLTSPLWALSEDEEMDSEIYQQEEETESEVSSEEEEADTEVSPEEEQTDSEEIDTEVSSQKEEEETESEVSPQEEETEVALEEEEVDSEVAPQEEEADSDVSFVEQDLEISPEQNVAPTISRDMEISLALEKATRPLPGESSKGTVSGEEYSLEETRPPAPKLQIHGKLSNQTAHRIYQPAYFTKIKNQLFLEGSGELVPSLRYRLSGRVYYDHIYDVSDHYSESAQSDQQSEIELRDAYLDYSHEAWDLRLGKQQVVWGEAVGLFVADVVNAKDLREFILPDFDMIRIPEWGMDLEYAKENFHSEFVLIPFLEFNKLGVSGSEFVFPPPLPTPATPFTIHDAKEPKDGFENAKVGTRFSYLWGGLDLGVFYLHSWTPSPVLFRTINSGIYNFDPQYKRLDTFGATFSDDINDTVYKGEFVLTKDAFFPVNDPNDQDGIARSSYLEYILGVDRTVFEKIDVNVQFSQRIIFDYQSTFFNQNRINNSVSLRLSRNFLNQKLATEFMIIAGLEGPDFMYRPSLKYNLTDNWQSKVGMDIFAGDPAGLFGEFKHQSRYYFELDRKF